MTETIIKHHRFYWEDADHLIKLAREYEAKIEEQEDASERDYYLYWKYRLARMSFIARMMSIEALLNNVLEQFSLPGKFTELDRLAPHFPRKERFPTNRRKRKNRPYQVPLKWKMYLTPYLCNADSRMEKDEYFLNDSGSYRKFRQLIMVRNEFVHTRVAEKEIDVQIEPQVRAQKGDDLRKFVIGEEFGECCQELGIARDPVCFKIDNALVCGEAMRSVMLELNRFLDGRILTRDFWESETLDIIR